jgi:hypothetical protein
LEAEKLVFESAEQVGIVGSPSTTGEITLDIVGEAARRSLVGSMVLLKQEMDAGRVEYALGTIAEVTTTNQWHENISLRGVIANYGRLANLSGRADVKGALMNVQAVYTHEDDGFSPAGSTLSMSPSTGASIRRVDDDVVQQLTERESENIFYLGDFYRMPGTRLPLNPSDFSGPRGAFHAGVFGPSGVGKSVFTAFYIAGQLRHQDLGIFIVDPQAQFTIEREDFLFSLQQLAKELGREVIIKNLATEIRLPQDKRLFAELLAKTPFFRIGLNFRYPPALEAAIAAIDQVLDKTKHWNELSIDDLLRRILQSLRHAAANGDIYKDIKLDRNGQIKPEGSGWKLIQAIDEALSGDERWLRLMRSFEPVASLFGSSGPGGTERMKMERLLHLAFQREDGRSRPLIILNMAFAESDYGDSEQVSELVKKLNDEGTKARILRTLFDQMERVAAGDYQKGEKLLNTLVVFDEAWRYAPRSSRDDEIKALSEQLAGYARETRKYGVGWMYVLQNPHALHPDVWDQLKSGFRALGFGLTGADLELIRAQVDHADSITLYRSFTQPSTTNVQYPFMLVGAISPLSFTMAPLYTLVYTTYQKWCEANVDWLPPSAVNAAKPEVPTIDKKAGPNSVTSRRQVDNDMFV